MDASKNFLSQRLCPIFQVSNVTGDNLDLLKSFMSMLRPSKPANTEAPAVFQIDETFSVPGVGTVISGTAVCGTITAADQMLLGPDSAGNFQPVGIKGIHRRRMPVKEVQGGQAASFALKKVKRAAIRKGMVLVHPSVKPVASWEFDAEVVILHHPTTITAKYVHFSHLVRQRPNNSPDDSFQIPSHGSLWKREADCCNSQNVRQRSTSDWRQGAVSVPLRPRTRVP